MMHFTDEELQALAHGLMGLYSLSPDTPAGTAWAKISAERDARREFNRGFNDA